MTRARRPPAVARLRAVLAMAWSRIVADPVGRTGLLATGAVATLGCTMLGSALAGAPAQMTSLVTRRVLGLTATPLGWGDGRRFTVADIRMLMAHPDVAVTCTRPTRAIMPTGAMVPVRWVAGTPAGLAALGGDIQSGRERGRVLRWSDTLDVRTAVVTGHQLAVLRGRGLRFLGDAGSALHSIGMLESSRGSTVDLAVLALLRPGDVAHACGPEAAITVGLIGPVATVAERAAALGAALRHADAAAPRPVPQALRLVPSVPTSLVHSVRTAQRATITVLSIAMAVFIGATVVTISVLVLVRAEGRRAELAVARSVGANRSAIAAEFLAEAMGLGVPSAAVGALVGWSVLSAASDSMRASGAALATALTACAGVVVTFGVVAAWTAWEGTRRPPHEQFGGARW